MTRQLENLISELLKHVGANIADARGRMSQDELAEKAKVSRSTIIRVEKGDKTITLDNFLRIAFALKIDPGILFLKPGEAQKVTVQAKLFWDEILRLRSSGGNT